MKAVAWKEAEKLLLFSLMSLTKLKLEPFELG